MTSQRRQNNSQFNNSSYEKSVSRISQIQNNSMINIKPLAYPCRYHPDQICLNYCIEQKCFQALCSQCIEEHLLHHKKTGLNDLYVKSFKSVRSQCSLKLMKIIDKLLAKLGILSHPKNPQQMLQNSDKQLQNIRQLMHQIIDQQFMKIKQAIKNKVSQNFTTVKQLNQIHQNLIKIINQLKQHNTIISQGINQHPVNVGDSIQKTLLLNQNALLEMFQKQSIKYDQKFRNINVEVLFSESQFRQSTVSCLRIGNSNSNNSVYRNLSNNKMGFGTSQTLESRMRSRSKSPINDHSFQINKKGINANYSVLHTNYPVLHYFETGQNILHLIDLKSQPSKISLELGNFKVPTFHATILSQKTGSILISGGNVQLSSNSIKSTTMSKFSLISNQFKKDFAIVKARSSHTLCQDFNNDCVYILGGYGETPQVDHDQSITMFETAVQKVNLKNGNVQQVRSSHWGGACVAIMSGNTIIKACMEGIQIYDTMNNFWYQISNIKGANIQNVFYRGAGYSQLGLNTILVYGGYDQNQENRKQCYLMTLNLNGESLSQSFIDIQKINSYLPIAEGFWNNPGIFYQNNLWVIQNVEDSQGLPVQSQRTLLKLDIESKKWGITKVTNKPRRT